MSDELSKLIDKLVEEKTFGLDALNAIKALRDRAQALEANLERKDKIIQERDAYIAKLTADLLMSASAVKVWEGREKALSDREGKITELEKNSAVARAESSTLRDVFNVIFRNVAVRETVTKTVPVARQYSGGGGDWVSQEPSTKTTETTKE